MRKRMITGYKSTFIIEVKDTYIFHKENGIIDLQDKTNIGGVFFEVSKISDNEFKIISRIQIRKRYALLDYNYLLNGLVRNYGNVTKATILGRYTKYRKDTWIEFDVQEDNEMVARNEWERGLYKVI